MLSVVLVHYCKIHFHFVEHGLKFVGADQAGSG